MADILTIAEEDQAVHGDLKPGTVRVSNDGAVSVEAYGMARSLERRFGAHVTLDATDQWVLAAMPDGVDLDLPGLAGIPADCGKELRYLELEALGDVRDGPLVEGGPSVVHLVLSSNGQRIPLEGAVTGRGLSVVRGRFATPITQNMALAVESLEAAEQP